MPSRTWTRVSRGKPLALLRLKTRPLTLITGKPIASHRSTHERYISSCGATEAITIKSATFYIQVCQSALMRILVHRERLAAVKQLEEDLTARQAAVLEAEQALAEREVALQEDEEELRYGHIKAHKPGTEHHCEDHRHMRRLISLEHLLIPPSLVS
jgi:hypothetical protein